MVNINSIPGAKIYTYEQIIEDPLKYEEVFAYISMYGYHSLAYSILQPKMNYFILEGKGLIAYAKYKKHSKRRFILGDPLANNDNITEVIGLFLRLFPKTSFVQTSERVARILNERGFYATPMGIETSLDLQEFDLGGEKKRKLRNNLRFCKSKILAIEKTSENAVLEKEIVEISNKWLQQIKKKRELAFLASPLKLKPNTKARIFVALKEDKPISFIIFNPLYINNKIFGYCSEILRSVNNAPRGTNDLILYSAIKKFRSEGLTYLSLGLSPLANLNKDNFNKDSKFMKELFSALYKYTERLYNFESLARHKRQFSGTENQTYVLHKKKIVIKEMIELFKICNII